MVDGLFLWPALRYGTGYQTVWEIRPSAETPSSVHWKRFYFQLTRVHSALELSGRCALQIYLLTYFTVGAWEYVALLPSPTKRPHDYSIITSSTLLYVTISNKTFQIWQIYIKSQYHHQWWLMKSWWLWWWWWWWWLWNAGRISSGTDDIRRWWKCQYDVQSDVTGGRIHRRQQYHVSYVAEAVKLGRSRRNGLLFWCSSFIFVFNQLLAIADHAVVPIKCVLELGSQAEPMVWPPYLSRDRKWARVTKCSAHIRGWSASD